MLTVGVLFVCLIVAFAFYVAVEMALFEVAWVVSPMMVFPAAFLWRWRSAKAKRISAEVEVAGHRAALRKAIADLDNDGH
ncbi:hypothetical protein [Sphingomonas sp.]|uniref:hypothetical protein n=1 Tax=Sphingomonas sp. TaxID=28214 RepID=UPI002DD66BB4|nr:hypothetical protein [Sphingomonas sp.]